MSGAASTVSKAIETISIPGAGLFESGKAVLNKVEKAPPDPAAPPKAPNPDDPATSKAVGAAADEETQKLKGQAANMLTGGQGLLSDPVTSRATLLGS